MDCSIRKGAGVQRPRCAKGRDPRTPASWRHLLLRVVTATSVAADPSDTTLRRRTILSDTKRVDGRTRQHSRRTAGTDYWDIHSYIFPIVSSALFQTLRRHWCRLLWQRLNFSTPSRVVVSSDVVGSGKHWSLSDCRASNPVAGKARNRSSFDTPSVRENAAQFLFCVSLVLWRSPLTKGW